MRRARESWPRLAAKRGYPGPAAAFAASVGLRSRFQLVRILERNGLPSLEKLAGWIRLYIAVLEWERERMPLSRSALRSLRDPSPMSRSIRKLTGCTWSQVRDLGSDWVFMKLLESCRRPVDREASNAAITG